MRTAQHLAWLGIADGILVTVLMRRWATGGEPHHFIEVVTVFALLFGFIGAAAAALRGLRRQPSAARPPWLTTIAYSVLTIALLWRFAILGKPYTVLDAVTLSTLMLGFLRAAATTVESLGRAGGTLAAGHGNERQDALLLFPAEDAGANNRRITPPVLATRRNALL